MKKSKADCVWLRNRTRKMFLSQGEALNSILSSLLYLNWFCIKPRFRFRPALSEKMQNKTLKLHSGHFESESEGKITFHMMPSRIRFRKCVFRFSPSHFAPSIQKTSNCEWFLIFSTGDHVGAMVTSGKFCIKLLVTFVLMAIFGVIRTEKK